MMPLRRLDTLVERPSLDVVDERGEGGRAVSRGASSSSDSRVPQHRFEPSPDRHGNGAHGSDIELDPQGEGEEPQATPPSWAAEPRDGSGATRNPLLKRPQWNPRKNP